MQEIAPNFFKPGHIRRVRSQEMGVAIVGAQGVGKRCLSFTICASYPYLAPFGDFPLQLSRLHTSVTDTHDYPWNTVRRSRLDPRPNPRRRATPLLPRHLGRRRTLLVDASFRARSPPTTSMARRRRRRRRRRLRMPHRRWYWPRRPLVVPVPHVERPRKPTGHDPRLRRHVSPDF